MLKRSFYRRNDYWVLPAAYIACSLALAAGIDYVDQVQLGDGGETLLPSILLTKASLAEKVLTAIATSLLTMTTITFSVMMVVLSTYTSQYSPRVLPNFTRSSAMQHAQGIFFAGFVYSIAALYNLKQADSDQMVLEASVAVGLAVLCLLYFIFFIHKVSLSIQVNQLIADIGSHARIIVRGVQADTPSQPLGPPAAVVKSEHEGYLRTLSYPKLMKAAEQAGAWIRVVPAIGQFVRRDEPLFEVYVGKQQQTSVDRSRLARWARIGPTRTNEQDLQYVIEKIIEIALRAISPSVNDPNTAIYCVRQLGQMLELATGWRGAWVFRDGKGVSRLEVPVPTFEEMLYKSFYQIRHYAAADLSVTLELLEALTRLAQCGPEHVRAYVCTMGEYVLHNIDEKSVHQLDRQRLSERWQRLAAACGREAKEGITINGQQ